MRYLITGGSGYIGTRLVQLLARREDTEKIVIADVVPPKGGYQPKTEFERVDVRDRGAVHSALQRANPDVLVHLAFILNPSHDEGLMYDVDVNGTHNALEAAAEAGIAQVLVTTSAVAYGAFPDNPDPITEDHPVRGVARFSYARDKTESDRIVQLWALQHPDVVTTIVRPCIVFGPNVDNYLLRLWTKQPFAVDAGNLDGGIQFVHEDDVVDAISRLLLGRHAGQFNLSPDGLMTLRECAEALDTPIRKLPVWLYRRIGRVLWHLRLSEAPPGQIDFALYPWIVSNEKLKTTLAWTPKHTSRETFEIAMRAHGKLPPAAAPVADASTNGRDGDALGGRVGAQAHGAARAQRAWHAEHVSETSKPSGTELKELMGRVLESDASEAFGHFVVRHMALSDLAPAADDAVLDGIEESPDGGAAMAEAHLSGMSEDEREELLERAAMETGRRLHSAAFALLSAVGAARLPVDVTPEMVAVAAITELGDSSNRP